MKQIAIIFIFTVFLGCKKDAATKIHHLNGYWEIQEVILPNGERKQYAFNETIDFISVNDSLKGFRKKLKPGINNTYYTSDDTEALRLEFAGNNLNDLESLL